VANTSRDLFRGVGAFEIEVKPDAYVTGAAAGDTQGPTLCFGESRRGAKTLVTITAVDSSGIFYAVEAPEGKLPSSRTPER
jgi:hypothetical protein